MRVTTRENWPQENAFAYVIIPHDEEKRVAVEEIGPIKIATGVVLPHPDDENKCIFNILEKANLKYVPNFALKALLKKEVLGKFSVMVVNFKKSDTYAALQTK